MVCACDTGALAQRTQPLVYVGAFAGYILEYLLQLVSFIDFCEVKQPQLFLWRAWGSFPVHLHAETLLFHIKGWFSGSLGFP
jgi:hypothetical protein